jgi:hypothetical protein
VKIVARYAAISLTSRSILSLKPPWQFHFGDFDWHTHLGNKLRIIELYIIYDD